MSSPTADTGSLGENALRVLRSVNDNRRGGHSNRIADVRTAQERLDMSDVDQCIDFLRERAYLSLDGEHQLAITEQGLTLLMGSHRARFEREAVDFLREAVELIEEPEPEQAPEDLENTATWVEELTEALDRSTVSLTPPEEPKEIAVSETQNPKEPRQGKSPEEDSSSATATLSKRVNQAAAVQPKIDAGKAGELDGRYTRIDTIGEGPLGVVFRAQQNALGLEVCIKELKDLFGYFSFLQRGEVQKRLRKELCAQAQVRHPAVVAVLDQNTDAARPYAVLELLGDSLQSQLHRNPGKGVAPEKAVRWFLQLCYGLRAAHAAGLTHHNLKPANVLLDARGNAKLSDFGLARVVESDPSRVMPQVFVNIGGMSYLAPELLQKKGDAGPAADIYGLGMLLHEMLTGGLPARRSPLPSEVNRESPARLDAIFDRMTQDRLDKRYPDFDAVLSDFYDAFSGSEYLQNGDLILSS